MSASTNGLTLFDRIKLANSAMERAKLHVFDQERFMSEYETARLWVIHKVVTTEHGNYISQ